MIGPIIPPGTKFLVAVTVLAMIAGAAYIKGRDVGMEKYYEYKSSVEAASAKAQAESEARIRSAESATAGVAVGWDRAVRDLERQHTSRLLSARRDCAASRSITESSAGTDEGSADAGPSAPSFEATCVQLEKQCAKTTGALIWLQDWVRGVCR